MFAIAFGRIIGRRAPTLSATVLRRLCTAAEAPCAHCGSLPSEREPGVRCDTCEGILDYDSLVNRSYFDILGTYVVTAFLLLLLLFRSCVCASVSGVGLDGLVDCSIIDISFVFCGDVACVCVGCVGVDSCP